ncbi:MAG: hypothetical protein KAJ93_06360 [Methanosarcinales archaeon]|nr:hypothetical protein [Methanosarcinales archaeon]
MNGEIQKMLENINEMLEELLFLRNDLDKLNNRTENMEKILSEYLLMLNDEEKADLDEAMEEYTTGKTTSLDDAKRYLEL